MVSCMMNYLLRLHFSIEYKLAKSFLYDLRARQAANYIFKQARELYNLNPCSNSVCRASPPKYSPASRLMKAFRMFFFEYHSHPESQRLYGFPIHYCFIMAGTSLTAGMPIPAGSRLRGGKTYLASRPTNIRTGGIFVTMLSSNASTTFLDRHVISFIRRNIFSTSPKKSFSQTNKIRNVQTQIRK